jgi:hypothetical protein
MIILGVPKNPDDYFIADEILMWELEQAGFSAKYLDEDAYYFKKNKKLLAWLDKHEIKE